MALNLFIRGIAAGTRTVDHGLFLDQFRVFGTDHQAITNVVRYCSSMFDTSFPVGKYWPRGGVKLQAGTG